MITKFILNDFFKPITDDSGICERFDVKRFDVKLQESPGL